MNDPAALTPTTDTFVGARHRGGCRNHLVYHELHGKCLLRKAALWSHSADHPLSPELHSRRPHPTSRVRPILALHAFAFAFRLLFLHLLRTEDPAPDTSADYPCTDCVLPGVHGMLHGQEGRPCIDQHVDQPLDDSSCVRRPLLQLPLLRDPVRKRGEVHGNEKIAFVLIIGERFLEVPCPSTAEGGVISTGR